MANIYDTYKYDNSLTAEHLAANGYSFAEAARTGFFTFIISDLDGIQRPETTDASKTFPTAKEAIKLHVIKAPVPHFSLEVLEYRRGNEQVKFAGVPTFDSGSLVVDDVIGPDTKSILVAWHQKAYDPHTRMGGRMKDYKRLCTLAEYSQDYVALREWTLYGCWISELSEDDFDKENDGKRQITATIQYDRAEMTKDYTQGDAIEQSGENQ